MKYPTPDFAQFDTMPMSDGKKPSSKDDMVEYVFQKQLENLDLSQVTEDDKKHPSSEKSSILSEKVSHFIQQDTIERQTKQKISQNWPRSHGRPSEGKYSTNSVRFTLTDGEKRLKKAVEAAHSQIYHSSSRPTPSKPKCEHPPSRPLTPHTKQLYSSSHFNPYARKSSSITPKTPRAKSSSGLFRRPKKGKKKAKQPDFSSMLIQGRSASAGRVAPGLRGGSRSKTPMSLLQTISSPSSRLGRSSTAYSKRIPMDSESNNNLYDSLRPSTSGSAQRRRAISSGGRPNTASMFTAHHRSSKSRHSVATNPPSAPCVEDVVMMRCVNLQQGQFGDKREVSGRALAQAFEESSMPPFATAVNILSQQPQSCSEIAAMTEKQTLAWERRRQQYLDQFRASQGKDDSYNPQHIPSSSDAAGTQYHSFMERRRNSMPVGLSRPPSHTLASVLMSVCVSERELREREEKEWIEQEWKKQEMKEQKKKRRKRSAAKKKAKDKQRQQDLEHRHAQRLALYPDDKIDDPSQHSINSTSTGDCHNANTIDSSAPSSSSSSEGDDDEYYSLSEDEEDRRIDEGFIKGKKGGKKKNRNKNNKKKSLYPTPHPPPITSDMPSLAAARKFAVTGQSLTQTLRNFNTVPYSAGALTAHPQLSQTFMTPHSLLIKRFPSNLQDDALHHSTPRSGSTGRESPTLSQRSDGGGSPNQLSFLHEHSESHSQHSDSDAQRDKEDQQGVSGVSDQPSELPLHSHDGEHDGHPDHQLGEQQKDQSIVGSSHRWKDYTSPIDVDSTSISARDYSEGSITTLTDKKQETMSSSSSVDKTLDNQDPGEEEEEEEEEERVDNINSEREKEVEEVKEEDVEKEVEELVKSMSGSIRPIQNSSTSNHMNIVVEESPTVVLKRHAENLPSMNPPSHISFTAAQAGGKEKEQDMKAIQPKTLHEYVSDDTTHLEGTDIHGSMSTISGPRVHPPEGYVRRNPSPFPSDVYHTNSPNSRQGDVDMVTSRRMHGTVLVTHKKGTPPVMGDLDELEQEYIMHHEHREDDHKHLPVPPLLPSASFIPPAPPLSQALLSAVNVYSITTAQRQSIAGEEEMVAGDVTSLSEYGLRVPSRVRRQTGVPGGIMGSGYDILDSVLHKPRPGTAPTKLQHRRDPRRPVSGGAQPSSSELLAEPHNTALDTGVQDCPNDENDDILGGMTLNVGECCDDGLFLTALGSGMNMRKFDTDSQTCSSASTIPQARKLPPSLPSKTHVIHQEPKAEAVSQADSAIRNAIQDQIKELQKGEKQEEDNRDEALEPPLEEEEGGEEEGEKEGQVISGVGLQPHPPAALPPQHPRRAVTAEGGSRRAPVSFSRGRNYIRPSTTSSPGSRQIHGTDITSAESPRDQMMHIGPDGRASMLSTSLSTFSSSSGSSSSSLSSFRPSSSARRPATAFPQSLQGTIKSVFGNVGDEFSAVASAISSSSSSSALFHPTATASLRPHQYNNNNSNNRPSTTGGYIGVSSMLPPRSVSVSSTASKSLWRAVRSGCDVFKPPDERAFFERRPQTSIIAERLKDLNNNFNDTAPLLGTLPSHMFDSPSCSKQKKGSSSSSSASSSASSFGAYVRSKSASLPRSSMKLPSRNSPGHRTSFNVNGNPSESIDSIRERAASAFMDRHSKSSSRKQDHSGHGAFLLTDIEKEKFQKDREERIKRLSRPKHITTGTSLASAGAAMRSQSVPKKRSSTGSKNRTISRNNSLLRPSEEEDEMKMAILKELREEAMKKLEEERKQQRIKELKREKLAKQLILGPSSEPHPPTVAFKGRYDRKGCRILHDGRVINPPSVRPSRTTCKYVLDEARMKGETIVVLSAPPADKLDDSVSMNDFIKYRKVLSAK
ncbi:hypothetical protein ADUPG1_012488 [Aduncisulcus paluster]|uniref:Uncharacterized protein n=1 Tax=Aduncisulcus paluster TaxID=2918883 RepID=A0ABQ5JZL9_9EUKA|nr:hypothetical protein ADUPG1_012488 [Aduncisulcus paluster]